MKQLYFIFVLAFISKAFAANEHQLQKSYQAPQHLSAADYVPNTIILKLHSNYRQLALADRINEPKLASVFQELGVTKVRKLFPFSKAPEKATNALGQALADITLIYEVRFTADIQIVEAINKCLKTEVLVYAEPKFTHKLFLTPNDASLSNQNAWLTKIQAYNAWNVSTGDTNVVIGIVDSGTDIDHPDLVANLKKNYNDPINGIDDDNDGYVDNFNGWDISESDNNPNVDNSDHGSHVSGCAAAATNNAIGVAGTGFNCKFLPVKCAAQASTTSIDNGYEGITYAADHGCNIINCSWGGGFSGSMEQDVITYAAINRNCLVMAAAGNDNVDAPSYPAAYQYVTSVAATTNSDLRANFSNYNYSVDVCAPGSNIYSTIFDNTYTYNSGTSMASPVAAGAAALIKSMNPSFTGLQVGEQLRVTCTDIYNLPFNTNCQGRLGKGRINMSASLTQHLPSVRMEPINITDGNDDTFVINDTLKVTGKFINYLSQTTNCMVTLTAITNSQYVTIQNASFTIGALNTFDSIKNTNSPFKIIIKPNTPANTKVLFKLSYVDGTAYTDLQTFDAFLNVDYINININNIATTITSKGRLFYNADTPTQGLGFQYKDSSMVYDGGLIIGVSNTQLVNTVRGASTTPDNDFSSTLTASRNVTAPHSDFDVTGSFNDNNAAAAAKLNLSIDHFAYAWTSPNDLDYVIVEYKIKNNSTTDYSNLYAGIFTDWDIQNYSNNKSDVDASRKLGYAYCSSSTQLYAGVKVLTNGPFNLYAADNVTGGAGGVDLSDGITTAEKFQILTTSRTQAGATGTGADVINTVSTGPLTLKSDSTVTVAFALLAGDNLAKLQASADFAQVKYDGLYSSIAEVKNSNLGMQLFPNPAANKCMLTLNSLSNEKASISILDVMGKLVYEGSYKLGIGKYNIDLNLTDLTNGVYYVKVSQSKNVQTEKLLIQR
jgi:subtilisin family serine protease